MDRLSLHRRKLMRGKGDPDWPSKICLKTMAGRFILLALLVVAAQQKHSNRPRDSRAQTDDEEFSRKQPGSIH